MLATEPTPENASGKLNVPGLRRMKKAFTPEEVKLARQIVEAIEN
jgi:hypothetical protein